MSTVGMQPFHPPTRGFPGDLSSGIRSATVLVVPSLRMRETIRALLHMTTRVKCLGFQYCESVAFILKC